MVPAFQHYGGYTPGHGRTNSQQIRLSRQQHPTSPGPQRSPTDISLAAFSVVDDDGEDVGEGTSNAPVRETFPSQGFGGYEENIGGEDDPPEYESPTDEGTQPLLRVVTAEEDPPIPSYEAAVGEERRGRAGRSPRRR